MRMVRSGMVVVAVCALTAATEAGKPAVTYRPAAEKGEPMLSVDTGAGVVHYNKKDGSPVMLVTPQQIEKPTGPRPWIPASDPFLFISRVGENPVIYWGTQEVSVRTIRDVSKVGEGAQTAVVALSAAKEGLRKEAFLSITPGEAVVYVTSRLTAEKAVRLTANSVSFAAYVRPHIQPWKMELDGQEVQPGPKKRIDVKSNFYWRRLADNVGCAIVVDERGKVQDDWLRPRMRCFRSETAMSVKLIGRRPKELKKGKSLFTRHILLWGDGDLRPRIKKIAEDLAAGKLDGFFHVPEATTP